MDLFKVGEHLVDILGTLVPAVNIQVDGVPGIIELEDHGPNWYGIYFELLFEDGNIWVVEQGWDEKDLTTIKVTGNSPYARDEDEFLAIFEDGDWDKFLVRYRADAWRTWCPRLSSMADNFMLNVNLGTIAG